MGSGPGDGSARGSSSARPWNRNSCLKKLDYSRGLGVRLLIWARESYSWGKDREGALLEGGCDEELRSRRSEELEDDCSSSARCLSVVEDAARRIGHQSLFAVSVRAGATYPIVLLLCIAGDVNRGFACGLCRGPF